MPRRTLDQRLADLEAKRAALLQKKRDMTRSQDTRRKVLAGAAVLTLCEDDPALAARFREHLDRYLTRADDRALFDLPPSNRIDLTEEEARSHNPLNPTSA